MVYLSVFKLIYKHFTCVSSLFSRAKNACIISCIQCRMITVMINIKINIYYESLVFKSHNDEAIIIIFTKPMVIIILAKQPTLAAFPSPSGSASLGGGKKKKNWSTLGAPSEAAKTAAFSGGKKNWGACSASNGLTTSARS